MRKLYLFILLSAWITLPANMAWSETQSRVFKLSVTLPQTITLASEQNKLTAIQELNLKTSQMVQEQNMLRDQRMVLVRSIVAR
jgi:hypothetical protein